jgi:orotidine-5'-phosphate decarboxylase
MTSDPRDRLVLALDVDRLDDALAWADRLRPWVGVAKVGYQLYAAEGPAALEALRDKGFRVFADLKLHDIPTTVEQGARALGRHGVDFLNFHAAGGEAMLRAGIAGLRDGARERGHAQPVSLAVTVLTSDHDTNALDGRVRVAADAGCDGVVCAASDVARARAAGLRAMVPGIRRAGGAAHDQVRIATPFDAISLGADWIVLGRAVTGADDPERVASAVLEEVAAAASGPPD